MKRPFPYLLAALILAAAPACRKDRSEAPAPASPRTYVIGIFQSVDSPTANEARRGILKAFEDAGLREGENVHVRISIAAGDRAEVLRTARTFAEEKVNLVIPLSTQCLQAALLTDRRTPIVFGAVATPYLVGAGKSAVDHLSHVTGVASTGPVRQAVRYIHEVLPGAKRIGTLWTPSEVNSEFYLDLAREACAELGLELIAVPVPGAAAILQAAQVLVNRKVDVLFPISDNTINSSFEILGRVAGENRIPLFGAFLRSVEFGAAAALGFNFYDMGYRTGRLAVRVMNGESPGRIPIQAMEDVKTYINLDAAGRQGLTFPPALLARADRVIREPATTGAKSVD